MRLFVGVWLSETMREEVVEYIKRIRQGCSGFKWTNPQNLHFTMKFLGEIPENRLKELSTALRSAAAENKSFSLKLGSTGFFPQRGTPRIVWIGVDSGKNELCKLADSIEFYSRQQKFRAADKPFQPHLTIARAKNDIPGVKLPDLKGDFTSETIVNGFSLIESRLFSTGPVYQTLEEYNLNC